MTYTLNNEPGEFEARKITILIGENEFHISVNKFDDLVVNKAHFGNDETSIMIVPSVSNEIRIK